MATVISADRLLVTKAKQKAAEWMPYLQSVFMPMRCTPTPKVPTAAVDQYGRMYYNPDFFGKLSVEVVAYIILHECLHLVLSHHKRTRRMCPNITKQKAYLANIAQDLCIQQALSDQIGRHEPADIVTIGGFSHIPGITPGKTSEQYFEALCAYKPPKPPTPPTPPQPRDEEEDEDEEDDSQEGWSDEDSEDEDETTDDAEDGDSESDSGEDCDEDSESESEQGSGDSDEDSEGSDSDSDGEGSTDSSGGDGDGTSNSGEDSNSDGGSGSGSGASDSGEGDLDTDGLPELGDVCNPADAGSASDGLPKEWEEEPTLADVSSVEKRLRDAETALDELNPRMGSGAGNIRQALKARLHPVPDPFDQLAHVVSRSIASPVGQPELTYRKWPRRTLPGKARLRGVQRLQPEATILLDTSGSMMNNAIMQRALAVVAKGISRLQNPRVVCCDGAIQSAKRIANMAHFNWDGGGGTDMAAGLVHVDQTYRPDSIVIITDGITYWPPRPTRAKVICALCSPAWAERIPKWITVVHLYRQGNQYVL